MKNESIEALKNLITEADRILATTIPLPENRTPRCRELLGAALALADDLRSESPAVTLGHKGGSVTAKRHGSAHYRQMAAARKTLSGGCRRKKSQ